MEAKPGEASVAPAPAAAATEAAMVMSFQSQTTAPLQGSVAEKGSSSGVLVSPSMATTTAAAAGGGFAVVPAVKVGKKRGRPRKYGPDGSLIRPLNATPISASVPMAASAVGLYTPASAVGAAMKRGRGRPLDFSAAGKLHHQQQFGFHFDSIGWHPSPAPIFSPKYSRENP
ncbi:hypothetical protein ABZP36_030830 [Zizania latifolia]